MTILVGFMSLLLVYFRLAFPKCTAAEMNAFLFNATPPLTERRFYSGSEITRCEDRMGFARKRGSTTARQAALHENRAKMHMYKNHNYPAGVADISLDDMIDWDQAGIFYETCDRGIGKAHLSRRVVEDGPYGHSEKFTLTLGIGGNGDRWMWFQRKAGTSIEDILDVVNEMMDDLPDGNQVRRRCFLCDNLASHKNPLVRNAVVARGHRLVLRPPYAPWVAPIEYVFNVIEQQLALAMHTINGPGELEEFINMVVLNMGGFRPFFEHCGYSV